VLALQALILRALVLRALVLRALVLRALGSQVPYRQVQTLSPDNPVQPQVALARTFRPPKDLLHPHKAHY